MSSKRRFKCFWNETADGFWETARGKAWEFTADGPKENGCKFCPYCGGSLVAQKSRDEALSKETRHDGE